MSIASEITRLQTAKADIKSAIEEKGVSVPSSASISTYDDYVLQIQTGGGGGSEDLKQLIQRTITSIDIPSGTTSIGGYAFYQCTSLRSISIPNSVTSIGTSAFYGCSSLSSVTIPNSVTSIGNGAFQYCSGLTSVTIPNSVTSINQRAFSQCSSLSSVIIPSGVTSIGESAFYNCSGLTSVIVDATTPPTLGASAFNNTSDCPIYVPCSSVSAYKAASRWSTYASRIQCEAQYRTTSGTPYCQGYDKYVDVYSQVSNDGGQTWTTTATTPTLVESDSEDCGYEPTPQCETPENLETYSLDDDFDTTKEVWNLWLDNLADLDGDEMTEEEEYYFTGYVVLSEDGQSRDYTIVASITEDSGWTVDICEYDADGENFAGNVLTALTEDVFIGMCDYFEKPMYVMDFSQYLVGEWSEMDDNTFDLSSPIYKVKMNAQDLYYTYSIDTFSGEWGFNESVDGMGTAYELGYNVELVDDHLEASIDIYENYAPVTSYTFSDLSSEEVIIDLAAIFGKPLYADDCNMKCVDGDDENCSLYAPLWNAFVSDGTKFNEFEVETEMEE